MFFPTVKPACATEPVPFFPPPSVSQRRAEAAGRLAADTLDVLVVGGGIVGAGAARDAAMRGLRVGLVEQSDLASGASSRSSRLLHGGLRYLAQGRIGLVYEASREKCILHRIAPHLAEPLAFVFPAYRGGAWPLWQLRIGVKLYDLLCGGRNLGPSRPMSAAEVLAHLPGMSAAGLTGAGRYFDALTNDARLVIDTLRSAAGHGAIVANYTRLESASPGRTTWQCRLHDAVADRPYEVTAQNVINATGPWAQSLEHSRVRLRLTKGVHLVIDRGRLPVPDAVVMAEGKRILFAIPWGQRVILGTTDTDYDGPLDDVPTEPADVAHILGVVNRAFPSAALGPADVISTWAGLRPLIASKRGGRWICRTDFLVRPRRPDGLGNPSNISRAHQIAMPEPGWFDVAGGKLTTYRLIAEQVIDRIAARTGRPMPPSRTAEEPLLPPGEAETAGSGILPPPVSRELVDRYCRQEWAVFPEDIMLRRAGWQHYLTTADAVAGQVAEWMREGP